MMSSKTLIETGCWAACRTLGRDWIDIGREMAHEVVLGQPAEATLVASRRGQLGDQHRFGQRDPGQCGPAGVLRDEGAVHVLTFSLAQSLVERGIRVNCVAPGPVWTPLIPSTMPEDKVEAFGQQVPMQRVASPDEIAPSFVFFAAPQLSSYYIGEVLSPSGGEIFPG